MNGDRAMVDGIDKLGAVNEIKTTGVNASKAEEIKLGSFGYGYKTADGAGISIDRNIPGLDALLAKFNDVTPPAYCRNVAQLTIADADYIPDGDFQERECCEV